MKTETQKKQAIKKIETVETIYNYEQGRHSYYIDKYNEKDFHVYWHEKFLGRFENERDAVTFLLKKIQNLNS